MGFLDPTDFRWILPTETDANSPLSEQLMSSIRNNLAANTLNRIGTPYSAQVISGGGTDTLTIEKISDDDDDWPTNITAGLIAVFRTGAQLGQQYFITANTQLLDSPDTATITTSTTFAANIAAGDELIIVYTQTGFAHTHDGVDSSPVGIDVNLGSDAKSQTQGGDDISLVVPLNNNIKSLYLILDAYIQSTGIDWATYGNSFKIWLQFDAADSFEWIDSTGAIQTNSVTDVNHTPTVYMEITNFVNVPDRNLLTRVAKLDITPLGLTHKELRRYPVKIMTDILLSGSSSAITINYDLIGSASVV